jgi:hypothetical protein
MKGGSHKTGVKNQATVCGGFNTKILKFKTDET